jgi:nitrite reductase/ring-hydroxylating ferredoxin subunit
MPGNYTTNGLHKVTGTKVLLGKDAGGFYARSSLCTHQQCNLNTKGSILSNGGAHCNCHGAEFDANGAATKGPAGSPLKSYKLTLECDGNLWVDTTTQVAADVRIMG